MSRIIIGSVVSTFGVRGDLKIYSLTDFASLRFKKGNIVYLVDNLRNQTYEVEVTYFKNNGKFIIVHFKGIDDMSSAEKYKGYSIYTDEENLHKLKKDQYYHYDLLKCEVYAKDRLIGKVIEISNNGAHDILRVKDSNNKITLIPFVKSWLISIDVENQRIEINDMEGM